MEEKVIATDARQRLVQRTERILWKRPLRCWRLGMLFMRWIWAHEQRLYARPEVLQLYDPIFTSLFLRLTIAGSEVGHISRDCPSEPSSGLGSTFCIRFSCHDNYFCICGIRESSIWTSSWPLITVGSTSTTFLQPSYQTRSLDLLA